MELKICHLYPDVLNLYGDTGNILCMRRRLAWRGIDSAVQRVRVGEKLDLTGGTASASGVTADGRNWDAFDQPLDSQYFTVDSSEFDNTKAGVYKIYVSSKTYPKAKDSFEVTVVAAGGTTCHFWKSGVL